MRPRIWRRSSGSFVLGSVSVTSWLVVVALAFCGIWLNDATGLRWLLLLAIKGMVLITAFTIPLVWTIYVAVWNQRRGARRWASVMVAVQVLAVEEFLRVDWDAISSQAWFSLHESGFVALGNAYDHRQLPSRGTRLPPRFRYLWAGGKASWTLPDQRGTGAGLLISTRAGCTDCTWSGFYYLPGQTPEAAFGTHLRLGHGWWWIR
jgi:hypothetical protein